MIIQKELKKVSFTYDFASKVLHLKVANGVVIISRIEMFSLARFILRIAQKGKPKK